MSDWVGGGGFCRDQRARRSRYGEAGEFSGPAELWMSGDVQVMGLLGPVSCQPSSQKSSHKASRQGVGPPAPTELSGEGDRPGAVRGMGHDLHPRILISNRWKIQAGEGRQEKDPDTHSSGAADQGDQMLLDKKMQRIS